MNYEKAARYTHLYNLELENLIKIGNNAMSKTFGKDCIGLSFIPTKNPLAAPEIVPAFYADEPSKSAVIVGKLGIYSIYLSSTETGGKVMEFIRSKE